MYQLVCLKSKAQFSCKIFFHRNLQLIFKLFSITRLPLNAINNKTKIERETRKFNKETGTTVSTNQLSLHGAELYTVLNLFFVPAHSIPRCSETRCVQVGTALILTRAVHLISTSSIAAGFIALIFTAVLCSSFPRTVFH